MSVISADQIPYTQFGEDLKFQKKNYSGLALYARGHGLNSVSSHRYENFYFCHDNIELWINV